MQTNYHLPPRLIPARSVGPGTGAELFVVEGESAGLAVAGARDRGFQAVLPFQGKPLNPLRHGPYRVLGHAAFSTLLRVLEVEPFEACRPARCPYDRILLLFDPDADGVHAAALTLLFFGKFLGPLVEAGRVHQVRAPVATVDHERLAGPIDAVSRADLDRVLVSLRGHGVEDPTKRIYRGLASVDADVLSRACLDPVTRVGKRLGPEDAESVRLQLGLSR